MRDVPSVVELGGRALPRLMMLCGFQVALKFLLGRMLDVIRSQGADQAQIYEYAP